MLNEAAKPDEKANLQYRIKTARTFDRFC